MTDEQRYLFDLQGYLVLEQVLDTATLSRMNAEMLAQGIADPENHPHLSRFAGFLNWGEDWRSLIDHPAVLPVLHETLGARFRLDHAYGMAARAGGEAPDKPRLHHHAGMFGHGCFYVSHGTAMHNGLFVVSWALTDAPAGAGGFCCIPGSHKALYPPPAHCYDILDNPLVQQVPARAGDVIIFTEALTHGTMPWVSASERRAVLLKYCPHYMQWAERPLADIPELTDRQRLIIQPPFVNRRETVEA